MIDALQAFVLKTWVIATFGPIVVAALAVGILGVVWYGAIRLAVHAFRERH